MTIHRFTATAWWTGGARKVDPSNEREFVNNVTFYEDDMTSTGWIRLGEGKLTVEIKDPNKVVAAQIEALDERVKKIKLDAEEKISYFEGLKNNLLALPNETSSESDRAFDQPHRGHAIDPNDDLPF